MKTFLENELTKRQSIVRRLKSLWAFQPLFKIQSVQPSHNAQSISFSAFLILLVGWIFLFIAAPFNLALANPPSKDQVLAKLKSLEQQIITVSANVRIENHYHKSKTPEIEEYKIYVKNRNKVRREWQKDKKRRVLEIIDGNTSWVVKTDSTTKKINLSSNSLDRISILQVVVPFPLLEDTAVGTSSQLTGGNFKKLKYIGTEKINGLVCWVFEGRNQSFWISTKDGTIRKSIGNKLGEPRVYHYYTEVVVNSKLDDQLFSYQPNKETEVTEITTNNRKSRTRRYRINDRGEEIKEDPPKEAKSSTRSFWQSLFGRPSSDSDIENAVLMGDIPKTSPAYYSNNALVTANDCNSALVDQGDGKIALYQVGNMPRLFPESGNYQKILDAKLSDNGEDYAFAVEGENWEQFIVANGRPQAAFTKIKFNSLTVGASGDIAYIGINEEQGKKTERVVFNGNAQDNYYAIHYIAVLDNGSAVAYGAMEKLAEHYIVLNGKRLRRFAWVESPVFGDSINKLAYVVGQKHRSPERSVVVGETVGPTYKKIYGLGFTGNGSQVFYAGHDDNYYHIHLGTEKWGPYRRPNRSKLIRPLIDKSGQRISYEVIGNSRSWIEQNGKQLGKKYKSIENVGYHPSTSEHIFFAADHRGNRWLNFIVVNGKETGFSPSYNDSGEKVFSPKKRKLAYKIFNDAPLGGAYFGAVVLSMEGDMRLVGRYAALSEVKLSSDGESFCFVAIVDDKLYRVSEKF